MLYDLHSLEFICEEHGFNKIREAMKRRKIKKKWSLDRLKYRNVLENGRQLLDPLIDKSQHICNTFKNLFFF